MWIVFGTKAELTRVPGGLKVERRCAQCGETATFYEKHATKTFRLYFVDIFDYERHRVMACGCCGAHYATDELGSPSLAGAQRNNLLTDRLTRAASTAEDYLERAGSAVKDGFSTLFSDSPPRHSPPSHDATPPHSDDEIDIDAEIEAAARFRPRGSGAGSPGVGGVDDDMEARFRELEEKARRGE